MIWRKMISTSTDGIPEWHRFLIHTLNALSDGQTQHRKDLEAKVIQIAQLTPEQLKVELKSGGGKALNRMGWAFAALKRAGALAKPARGFYLITDVGRDLLHEFPGGISEKNLMALPAWDLHEPAYTKKTQISDSPSTELDGNDPTELIELGVDRATSDVAIELIAKLRESHPEFFEKAVVALLIAMGYGGSERRVKHLGQNNDGGVDGVIDQDALGLNRVFVQAKRYAEGNTVQRPDLQKFVGALADKGATQGVFVTTSGFSSGAIEYVERIPNRVVLVDGLKLAELMIQYKVGVQIKRRYELVELDEDFFE
jgi:restriction system protein